MTRAAHNEVLRAVLFLALTMLPAFSFAQADPVAASEIRHLRELIAANDRLYGAQFDAQKATVEAALAAVKDATTKTETANEKRLESVNEFRGQLKDQAGTFVTRSELWGYFVGTIGVMGVLFSVLFRLVGPVSRIGKSPLEDR